MFSPLSMHGQYINKENHVFVSILYSDSNESPNWPSYFTLLPLLSLEHTKHKTHAHSDTMKFLHKCIIQIMIHKTPSLNPRSTYYFFPKKCCTELINQASMVSSFFEPLNSLKMTHDFFFYPEKKNEEDM